MKVAITPDALAQIAALPRGMWPRIEDVLERLEDWPRVSGVKRLTSEWKGFARVRAGDYRVIFRIKSDDEILVVRIAHRRDVYAD